MNIKNPHTFKRVLEGILSGAIEGCLSSVSLKLIGPHENIFKVSHQYTNTTDDVPEQTRMGVVVVGVHKFPNIWLLNSQVIEILLKQKKKKKNGKNGAPVLTDTFAVSPQTRGSLSGRSTQAKNTAPERTI